MTRSHPAARLLAGRSPIIVANRAPYETTAEGGWRRGAGGVVSAMLGIADIAPTTWVACARTDGERDAALAVQPSMPGHLPISIEFAKPGASAYGKYYGVIANPLLWFIQHYLWPLAYEPVIGDSTHDAWDNGYAAVNDLVARTVARPAQQSAGRPLVMFQDYHFYLAPALVRQLVPDVTMQHFVHIPWPTPHYWTVLPERMRRAIFEGILGNDVIGFQTRRDASNFLVGCEELLGLRVDHRERAVLHRGRVSWVRDYPVSVDVATLQETAATADVAVEEDKIRRWRPEKLIVRIDRTDPIKNIVRGFLAYELMLRRHPGMVGSTQFWAFLQPSRQDVRSYAEYVERIQSEVRRINDEFARPGWVPIRLELGESLPTAIAAYRSFDVLVVNSIADGMNLVAKEGMVLNERDGVLVLSENAGAHQELGAHALTVNPFDVAATADALHEALSMDAVERRRRASAIRTHISQNGIATWLGRQLDDINELAPRSRTTSRLR